jgi:hypothetical protein
VDFNNDGQLDLIIGEYGVKTGTPTGKVRYFERNSDGTLKQSVPLECAGEEITNRYMSPCIVDWNNDGTLDLVLGSNHKAALVFINRGTKEAYRFDASTELTTVSGKDIGMKHGRQQVRVVDLDHDGKKDLITCGWNHDKDGELFFFFKNVGTDAEPRFDEATTLKYEDGTDVTTRAKACNARFAIYDYNSDGIEDLIFVDYRDGYYNPVKLCLGTED